MASAPDPKASTSLPTDGSSLRPEERAVIAALRELRFGTLEVVVHQSRVVQLTRSEKQRFDPI